MPMLANHLAMHVKQGEDHATKCLDILGDVLVLLQRTDVVSKAGLSVTFVFGENSKTPSWRGDLSTSGKFKMFCKNHKMLSFKVE